MVAEEPDLFIRSPGDTFRPAGARMKRTSFRNGSVKHFSNWSVFEGPCCRFRLEISFFAYYSIFHCTVRGPLDPSECTGSTPAAAACARERRTSEKNFWIHLCHLPFLSRYHQRPLVSFNRRFSDPRALRSLKPRSSSYSVAVSLRAASFTTELYHC